jgi:hypothetical protein
MPVLGLRRREFFQTQEPSHVKAIFAKMNVISRTEAVANATRRGLIQL